jgi:alkylation response protein AidB-like acyl-CoA dehydrogenase
MDLDFTPEQDLLRETVRGVCAQHAPFSVVREMEDDPFGYPAPFWKQLAALDLVGILLPERWGGSAMSMLDAAVVYEEFGRSLAPSPHFASSIMSGGVIERAGSDEQRNEWLPKIATGEAIVVPAWLEPGGGFGERGVHARAEVSGDGWVITGRKRHVAFAAAAERLLVLARTNAGVDLFLVPRESPGVALQQQFTIGSDTQYAVSFESVHVAGDARLAGIDQGAAWRAWSDAMHDGIILLAAQAVGGAHYALEITTQYAKDRKQFDKPLGAFQALAHYLADAATSVDGAETLVWEAAWARSEGRDTARLAPMAKLFACQTFRSVTATAQQIFGGVGFTVEYDIQLFFRRAKQLQISWWDTRFLEELVAADVLDRPVH